MTVLDFEQPPVALRPLEVAGGPHRPAGWPRQPVVAPQLERWSFQAAEMVVAPDLSVPEHLGQLRPKLAAESAGFPVMWPEVGLGEGWQMPEGDRVPAPLGEVVGWPLQRGKMPPATQVGYTQLPGQARAPVLVVEVAVAAAAAVVVQL